MLIMAILLIVMMSGCGNVKDKEMTLEFSWGSKVGTYTGEVKNGLPDGKGKFITQNSEGREYTYDGQWKNGHMEGKGSRAFADGNNIEEGEYQNDELVDGKLTNKSSDGDTFFYEGTFDKNRTPLNGSVKITSENGNIGYDYINGILANPQWNTTNLDANKNGNGRITTIILKGNSNIKDEAIDIDAATVKKRPWDYYGKVIRFTGRAYGLKDFPPDFALSKEWGGRASVMYLESDGVAIEFFIKGSIANYSENEIMSVYAYPLGLADGITSMGGKSDILVCMGMIDE